MAEIPGQSLFDLFTRVDELLVRILEELRAIRSALIGREATLPEVMINKILGILDWNMPKENSVSAWIAETITVPAGSELTTVWRTEVDFPVKVKKLYVDPDVNCSYRWNIAGEDIEGNEIELYQPFKLGKYSTITLVVTNNGADDVDLDVLVVGWGEPGG